LPSVPVHIAVASLKPKRERQREAPPPFFGFKTGDSHKQSLSTQTTVNNLKALLGNAFKLFTVVWVAAQSAAN